MDARPLLRYASAPRRWALRPGTVKQLPRPAGPHLVIATSDNHFHETVIEAVRQLHGSAAFVRSSDEILVGARSHSCSLVFLDQGGRGSNPLAGVHALHRNAPELPFVLVGSRLTTPVTVEAMRLGAFTVLEKPLASDEIVATVRSMMDAGLQRAHSAGTEAAHRRKPGSTAERWAGYVLKACEAEGDLRTLGAWATFAGLSYSSLRESCRLAGVRPMNARDLTRVLRAVVQSELHQCGVDELLDVSDRRTLNALMTRAGLNTAGRQARVSVEDFLASQRLVPPTNTGLAIVRGRLLRGKKTR